MPRATSSRATMGGFDVHVHAPEVAHFAAVEQVAQGDQGGGLAGLARRVQHEVALGPNQGQKFIDVHPVQGRDGVVLVRAHRPFGVEEAHGPIMALAAHRCARGTAPEFASNTTLMNRSLPDSSVRLISPSPARTSVAPFNPDPVGVGARFVSPASVRARSRGPTQTRRTRSGRAVTSARAGEAPGAESDSGGCGRRRGTRSGFRRIAL